MCIRDRISSSVKIKNALNCRRSSGRTEKSVVPPEFGLLHTLVPLTGLPAGISSRSSGPPRPSSPVTLQGYHVFPRPSRGNFLGLGGLRRPTFPSSFFFLCLRRHTFCQQRQKVCKKRRLKPMVSKLPLPSSAAFGMGRKGN